jgi:hypothetical protein
VVRRIWSTQDRSVYRVDGYGEEITTHTNSLKKSVDYFINL